MLGCYHVIDDPNKIVGYYYFLMCFILELRIHLRRIEDKIDNLKQ